MALRLRSRSALAVLLVTAGLSATIAPATSPPIASAQTPTPGCVLDLTGMIGWWRGEDDLLAQVGPDLAGTVDFASGLVGRAMRFGGPVAQNVAATGDLAPVGAGVTVEAWIKPTITGQSQAVMSRWRFVGGRDDDSFVLLIGPTGDLEFRTNDPSGRVSQKVRVPAQDIADLYDGAFHHVAATRDANTLAVYVDGVLRASAVARGGPLNAALGTEFRLGSSTGAGNPFWYQGELDEPSVWSRALSAAEIGAIENRSALGKCDLVPVEQAKLTSTSTQANDRFGTSVAVNGSTAAIGSPLSSRFFPFDGSVYVYTGSGPTWTEQARLSPSDPSNSTFTGYSVDVDVDTVIAGSDGSNAPLVDSGAAYVFFRTGTAWAQQAKLVASDAAANDRLGYAVAVDGDTAVATAIGDDDVGADSGSAYVFTRTGTTWTQQAKLVASDAATADTFGASVAIDGDTIVVGAPGDNLDPLSNAGSAYVFTRTGTTWTEQAKLTAPTPVAEDQVGFSVSIDGDVVAVGAPFADPVGSSSGAVHVFRRTGTTWAHESQVIGLDTDAGDRFGTSVATNGTSIVVGAPRDGAAGSQRGSAYVFNRVGASWNEVTKLVPADNATGDQFGISVAISGSVLVGAHNDDDAGNNSGSAYVFAP
jgi:hypothetical protein